MSRSEEYRRLEDLRLKMRRKLGFAAPPLPFVSLRDELGPVTHTGHICADSDLYTDGIGWHTSDEHAAIDVTRDAELAPEGSN